MLDVHHDGDGGTVDVSIQDSDIQTFLKEKRLNKTILSVSNLFIESYSIYAKLKQVRWPLFLNRNVCFCRHSKKNIIEDREDHCGSLSRF